MNTRGPSPHVRNVRKPRESDSLPTRARESSTPGESPSRTMRILWGTLGFVMVVGIAGSVAWAARHYVRTSARFAITDIMTTGGRRHSPEELAALAGAAKGQNIFSIDLDGARERLLADPWIRDALVLRQLPGTLELRVIEREAAGLLVSGDGYLVMRDGTILKRVEAGDPTDVPIVTGVSLEQFAIDREGAMRTVRRALDLGFDYDRTQLAGRLPLQEIHVEQSGELSLMVGKNPIALCMGAPPYRRKLEQAARVVTELDRRGAKPDSIMLDNEVRADRVVVRMR